MAERTNQYAQACNECSALVPAGEGILWWQAGPDDGGDAFYRNPAGWRVSHRDGACDPNGTPLRIVREYTPVRGNADAERRHALSTRRALRAAGRRY